jgi:FAD/FMN-containing dehydrogenase
VVLSTLSLNRVVAHRHGDLTATVEAGARLDDVNRELARHGQWLPLDPPWSDRATIGGIVATNDAGPRRHRYGTPRDLIIGIEIARADGVRAKAGGIVVKNVAGYDLARLMTGSFGSLALITSATFGGEPQQMTGTSQAAPHVSGVAAMLFARFPELRGQPRRVKRILVESATDLDRVRDFQGAGLVDALRALQRP